MLLFFINTLLLRSLLHLMLAILSEASEFLRSRANRQRTDGYEDEISVGLD